LRPLLFGAGGFPREEHGMRTRKIVAKIVVGCCIAVGSPAAGAGAAPDGMARQMLEETNLARTQPGSYARFLREMRSHFHGNAYVVPGSADIVMTSEGVAAVDEAIRYLSRQPPLGALAWSDGLAEAAAELVLDEAQTGELGHSGRRSGDMRQRIERRGTWINRIAENIGYGPRTARLMVLELIVDDGVPDRGHRKTIFNPILKLAGAACGPHPVYQNMCVMDFAFGFLRRAKR
jgi:uncharacterized protein YkwD